MPRPSRTFLILGLLAASPSVPAVASTIRNVATATWTVAGGTARASSNAVEIETRPAPAARPTLSAFRYDGTAGAGAGAGAGAAVATPRCRTADGLRPIALGAAFADRAGAPATTVVAAITAGEPFLFKLSDRAANLDPAAVDAVTGVVATRGGDRETLTIQETGVDTGEFAGFIQTVAGSPPVVGDCVLTVAEGDRVRIEEAAGPTGAAPAPSNEVEVLIDPFGTAFDSADGTPVGGVTVAIVDADSGRPAEVFGDDGRSRYPDVVVTGRTVVDAGGARYPMPPGDYRFPLLRAGRYRLLMRPPAPYVAPSKASPAALARLRQGNGQPFALPAGSFGGVITLSDPAPVRVDLPLDGPAAPPVVPVISKTASSASAQAGDLVLYTVTARNPDVRRTARGLTLVDRLPAAMRLRAGTVRLDGRARPDALSVAADGRALTVALDPLGPGGTATVRYALEVRPDAAPGDAVNRASVRDADGVEGAPADALVRIEREAIAGRMTIIGQVLDGGCRVDPRTARGLPGVRVMLEDGSYSVTDPDGRYHFEGVRPGTHVVQIDPAGLPAGYSPVDCARTTRSGGSALSRFVEGGGGALLRVDFHAAAPAGATPAPVAPVAPTASPAAAAAKILSDPQASGAGRDWFAGGGAGIAWLFPEPEHNPRAAVVRVAIRHLPGQTVTLAVAGKPVDPVALDGTRTSPDGKVAVSLWRGIALTGRDTAMTAQVRGPGGAVVATLERQVHFASSPVRAVLDRAESRLVADGVTRPRVAFRLVDADGRPVHHGLVGEYGVTAPYRAAVEADARQARQLSGLERARPVWRVAGDEGLAVLELEPTTVSGTVAFTLPFRDGDVPREQRVEAWLDAGDRPWTIVGFAAGSAGFSTLSGRMEATTARDTLDADGRVALYARGRVQGRWLLTMAYDSDKREDDTRFGGTIDPQTYYTVYADRSEQRFDAASVRRLYLRLERPQFYALFGDYETGIDEPELARYNRALNGAKAEYRGERVGAVAFAADTPNNHRRDELQGTGLSGPYALGARDILANSERVVIEVRDRLRSDRIVERRALARHVDYDIDYLAGTLRFKAPVLSRSSDLDPQFVIADYETRGVAARTVNAGGRATWASGDDRLRAGVTAIQDRDARGSTRMAGADVRFRPRPDTELRAEIAGSTGRATAGTGAARGDAPGGDARGTAWLVEAEHHGRRVDALAYAREQAADFGVGQLNRSETGTRKIGADARLRIGNALGATASAYRETQLTTDARRIAARGEIDYRLGATTLRAGLALTDDRQADGTEARSSIVQLGAARRLLDNRLELDAQTEFALGGRDDSVDFPARHKLGARFALTPDVQLVGSYEIADGEAVDARTARIGFDVRPWAGARATAAVNSQAIAEYGPRSFAAFGLAQSVRLPGGWSVDASLDGSRTLGGIDRARVPNPAQPVASGGFLGTDGTLTEDFTAVTAGATYRAERWSAAGRAEYRAGERGDRYGLTAALLRQIGGGSAVGASLALTRADRDRLNTEVVNAALSWAYRPQRSRVSFLEKLELRTDRVRGAVLGESGPLGGAALLVGGDAASRRLVNSLSLNWSPTSSAEGEWLDRGEVALFWGSRYVFDRYDDLDIGGWSNLVGLDLHVDVYDWLDLGGSASVRQGVGGRSLAYAVGPAVGLRPFRNGWLSLGYNFAGFDDRDFGDARRTRDGPHATMRFKFDQTGFQDLGLSK